MVEHIRVNESKELSKATADDAVRRELVMEEVRRIQAHPLFAHSGQLKRFLDYTVTLALDGKGVDIKEYTIAVNVFGRPANFDPSSASIVRTQAGKLRTRLNEYYESLTENRPIRISYRPGSYCPRFDDDTLLGVERSPKSEEALHVLMPFAWADGHEELSKSLRRGIAAELAALRLRVMGLSVVENILARAEVAAMPYHKAFGPALIIEGSVRNAADGPMLELNVVQAPDGTLLHSGNLQASSNQPSIHREAANWINRNSPASRPAPIIKSAANFERFWAQLARVRMNCTFEDVSQAVASFEWQSNTEPDDPLGWAGMAIGLSLKTWFGYSLPANTELTAKAAAFRACNISRKQSQCLTAVGLVRGVYDCDFESAESFLLSALAADSKQIEAAVFLSAFSDTHKTNMEIAGRHFHRAIKEHPDEVLSHYMEGIFQARQRKHQGAMDSFTSAYHANPNCIPALAALAMCKAAAHEYEATELLIDRALDQEHLRDVLQALKIYCLGRRGRTQRASQLLSELTRSKSAVAPWVMGIAQTGVGDLERAQHQFAKCLTRKWPGALFPLLALLLPGIAAFSPARERKKLSESL